MRPPLHPDSEDGGLDYVLLNQHLPASDLERNHIRERAPRPGISEHLIITRLLVL